MTESRPILIAGPTASGKSGVALALAEELGGAIINADALQVYAGWRALTARPTEADEARAPHRLYGHVPVSQGHSAGRWLREAVAEIKAAREAGLVPIVVGGTGLYFAALTEGLADIPETPAHVRAAVEARLAAEGLKSLVDDLRRRDPVTHARIDLANPRRVVRALEALEATGEGLAALHDRTPPPFAPLSEAIPLRLMPERGPLHAAIDARFGAMLADGALEEARAALDWESPSPQALQALGAAELMSHLRGEISLQSARDRAVAATRRYAKRQLTWARNRMRAWSSAGTPEEALRTILASI